MTTLDELTEQHLRDYAASAPTDTAIPAPTRREVQQLLSAYDAACAMLQDVYDTFHRHMSGRNADPARYGEELVDLADLMTTPTPTTQER